MLTAIKRHWTPVTFVRRLSVDNGRAGTSTEYDRQHITYDGARRGNTDATASQPNHPLAPPPPRRGARARMLGCTSVVPCLDLI